MAKRIANIVSVLILAALFIFPSRFLRTFSDEIVALAEQTVDLVHREDWDTAEDNLEELNRKFRLSKETLQFFLDHDSVEQMDADMRACLQLIHAKDTPQTLMELEFIIAKARYLKNIEAFNWSTLM